MTKLRHILQLYSQGRSKLLIVDQTGVARNTIKKYLLEFNKSGLNYNEINQLSDNELEDLFVKQESKPLNFKHFLTFSPATLKSYAKK